MATRTAHISHVIWIVMENRSYSQVIGAPYISTLASQCGVATNVHNVSHPSLPNYIAMTSGRAMGQLPRTDCPTFCPVSGPSIFTQTRSWRVYAESMPGNCVRHNAGSYVVHHTAAPYYVSVTNCVTNDVPLTALNLAALPSFSLIVPNVRNDMHESSSSVSAGDSWLRTHLGAILASAAYRSGSTVVFLTWDEGGTPRRTNACATNATDPGCHIALLDRCHLACRGNCGFALVEPPRELNQSRWIVFIFWLLRHFGAPNLGELGRCQRRRSLKRQEKAPLEAGLSPA